MEREAALRLRFYWGEVDAQIPRRVQAQLRTLQHNVIAARAILKGATRDTRKHAEINRIASQVYQRHAEVLLRRHRPAVALAREISERMRREQIRQQEQWQRLIRSVTRFGFRIGWFAYRLVMIGRIIIRWMQRPIQRMIDVMRNWERSLEEIMFGMALLELEGLATGETLSLLERIMEELPDVGMQVQGMMSLVTALFALAGTTVMRELVPAFVRLLEVIMKVWSSMETQLIVVIRDLIDRVLPVLIRLIEEAGPAFIIGIAQGLATVIPMIVEFLHSIRGLMPYISRLIGFLIPLAPVMVAIGTALYFVGPVMEAIAASLKILAALAGLLHLSLVPLASAIGAAVIAFLLLKDIMGPIPALFASLAVGIGTYLIVMKLVTLVLAKVTALGLTAAPAIKGLGVAIGAAGAAAIPAIPVMLALGGMAVMIGAGFYLAGHGIMMAVGAIIQLIGEASAMVELAPAIVAVGVALGGLAVSGLALIPAALAIGGTAIAMYSLAGAVTALAGALITLSVAAETFNRVGGVVHGLVGSLTGAFHGLAGAIGALCFEEVTPSVKEYSRTLRDALTLTREMRREVGELGVGLGPAGRGRTAGPQYITIYPSITIGEVTGVADLEMVQEAVSRGLSEALRRA